MITSQELRQKYINFYKKNGHAEIPSASLIPENDPSTLFTTAGMHPLVPFLLGEKHPAGNKLVNSQKCIRTGDIDEVGDKVHHTFFEMLGHWSLGKYFKKEAIQLTYDFVINELKLNKDKLAVSVFAGNENTEFDSESFDKWKELGFSANRIAKLNDNWWEQKNAITGPCGPDTEMFYWTGDKKNIPEVFNPEDKNWVEIGNDVLMQYEKKGENNYQPAKQKNIDNGTGLERLLAVINNLDDNYQTDLFLPIIEKIEKLSGKKYGENENETRSMRIIVDHLRSATFIMGDEKGIAPSNVDQGYVVRKLIRRAIRHGKLIGINEIFCHKISQVIIDLMGDIYSELKKNKDFVLEQIQTEEEKFRKTIQKGEKKLIEMFDKVEFLQIVEEGEKIPNAIYYKDLGKDFFVLFSEDGFPLELSLEALDEKRVGLGWNKMSEEEKEKIKKEFNQAMQKHQELSRTASAGKFKGGLANHSEQTIKYHTAAHLLLEALRRVLGDHVYQKSSNITEERLRFDFSHAEKMTEKQKAEVEKIVNEQIEKKSPVEMQEMTLDEAKKIGAMGVFENKYGDKVKVYSIGNFSKEICGGPHVKNTGELGKFKIKKEQSSSAGVRRIKAVLN
jgi:alanyl-tRNA synthetase